jgi:nucleoside-diphosphate-sugar epimerase
MRRALVLGAGGFIGGHLVNRLKEEGFWVRGVDRKQNEWQPVYTDHFILGDLRDINVVKESFEGSFDFVFQLAADMGGAGFVFTGRHDADLVTNSAMINLNVARVASQSNIGVLFFSSSACVYPSHNQLYPDNIIISEDSAFPANPDSVYGWEKLFSEIVYDSYRRNYNLDIRVARFHNIYGEKGTWKGGREKSIAALCRKIAQAKNKGEIEVWGDGTQTRSYLHVEDCLDAVLALVNSPYKETVNIGSEEMVSINQLISMISSIARKNIRVKYVLNNAPVGVKARTSDNRLIKRLLGWSPRISLEEGLKRTYFWIEEQVRKELA